MKKFLIVFSKKSQLLAFVMVLALGCKQIISNEDFIKAKSLYESSKTADKVESISYFVKVGDSESYNYLLKLLKDKNSFVKARAIRGISELKKENSIELLLPYLFDNDSEISHVTETVIKSFGSKTTLYIKKKLVHGTNAEKRLMIKSIGILKDKNLTDALGKIAIEDSNSDNRSAAIASLSQLDDDIAWMIIAKCFEDRNPYIVLTALKSINITKNNDMVRIIKPLLNDSNKSIVNEAVDALGRNGAEEGAYLLIKKLEDVESDSVLITKITNSLSKLVSKNNLQYYISALNSSKGYIRYAILKSAILSQDSKWSKIILLKASKNDSPEIRNLALLSIQEKDENLALISLKDSLKDSDPTVRANSVKSLSEMDEATQFEKYFKEVLKDKDINVRIVAIRSIGKIRQTWVFEELKKILFSTTDKDIIIACIESLGDYKSDNEVIDLLAKYFMSDNNDISMMATNSLIKTKSYKAKDLFLNNLKSSSVEIKLKSIYALDQLGDYSTLISLSKLVNDENEDIRQAAKSAYEGIIARKKIRDSMKYK